MNPMPNLGSRDFGGGGVLHQVVKGDTTEPSEPGFEVLDGDSDIVA
jgi:hypothetical protein